MGNAIRTAKLTQHGKVSVTCVKDGYRLGKRRKRQLTNQSDNVEDTHTTKVKAINQVITVRENVGQATAVPVRGERLVEHGMITCTNGRERYKV